MDEQLDWKHWRYGLYAALINAVASGLLLVLVDPAKFNMREGFFQLVIVASLFGVQGAANYLKQSPFPKEVTVEKTEITIKKTKAEESKPDGSV